jgi:hypothetical protein
MAAGNGLATAQETLISVRPGGELPYKTSRVDGAGFRREEAALVSALGYIDEKGTGWRKSVPCGFTV